MKNRSKNFDFGRYSIFFITILVFLILSFSRQNFFTYNNVYSLFYGLSIEFYAIIGFTFVMIMGEIDLSIGSVFASSGVLAGFLLVKTGMNIWLAIIIAICFAALAGFINGLFVVKFKVNSLMMTIGTMILFRGVADGIIRNLEGLTFPSEYRQIAKFKIFENINLTIILMILIIIILELLLNYNIVFRKFYYIGENIFSAKLYGINTDKLKISAFIIASITAGIAGILAASRSGHSVHNTGVGLEFKMVTAAVLGGASLFGGKGTILKSAFGLMFLAIIFNGLIMFKIDPVWTGVATGFVLLIAIVIDTRINKEKLEY